MKSETIYWFIVLLTFLYTISKSFKSPLKVLIILCFYSGLAGYLGKGIENSYKIILVLLSIYVLVNNSGVSYLNKKENYLIYIFILFSISFLYSAVINDDYFTLIFSQYGKYVTPICFFLILKSIQVTNAMTLIHLKDLFLKLITIQIFLSIIKLLTIGLQESTVGSISNIGGGAAAILPILGFILLWLHKQGEIDTKDWIYIFLLLFIGVASLKRAIWFTAPVIIFLFMYYVPRKTIKRKILFILPIVLLIFYTGVRVNPTLNREHKIGGSFDLNYVLDYSREYTFGNESESGTLQFGEGRGGATLLILNKLFVNKNLSFNDFWGFGLQQIYTVDYKKFDEVKFGIESKGTATGIFQTYITAGYIGVFLTVLLLFSVINLIKEKRIRVVIALFLLLDYFFYSGLILRIQTLSILLFFIIIYSNLQFQQRLYDRYLTQNIRVQNKKGKIKELNMKGYNK